MRFFAIILFTVLSGCTFICNTVPEMCAVPSPVPTPTPEPEPTPEPTPDPEPPPQAYMPPTLAELAAQGKRVEVRPSREGRKGFGATVRAEWGVEHYCRPETAWPEACAEGRVFGPVAPDGPTREKWEVYTMGGQCAFFSFESDTHMSFDPWIVQDEVNQNHPRNVRVCGQGQFETHASWVVEPYQGHNYIVAGQWAWTTAHGNGRVCAEGKDGVGKVCVNYLEP